MTIDTVTKMQLESLSNELLLEIFEHLDIYSLFNAFNGLNQRFHDLICVAPVRYESDGDKKYDENIWKSIATVIKPSQIRSIFVNSYNKVDERFLNGETTNVKSFVLRSTKSQILDEILEKLPANLELVNFSHAGYHLYHELGTKPVINLFFDKHQNQFKNVVNAWFNSTYLSEIPSSKHFFNLRRLHLDLNLVSPEILQILRNQTPNLKSLCLVFPPHASWNRPLDQTIRLENIRELDISVNAILPYFFQFLSVFVNLTKLRVLWTQQRRSSPPCDGSHWQKLFEQHLTKVERFTLEFSDNGADQDLASSFYVGDFWSKKEVHQRQIVNRSRKSTPKIRSIYFDKEWHFEYFQGTELDRYDHRFFSIPNSFDIHDE